MKYPRIRDLLSAPNKATLAELARIAQIDPSRFLIGANLQDIDLRGEDLTMFDLSLTTGLPTIDRQTLLPELSQLTEELVTLQANIQRQFERNALRQRTIASPVHCIGIGVHNGAKVRMTLRPADANAGINFVRTDTEDRHMVKAHPHNVSDTTLGTSLYGENGTEIASVQALLSALWGLGIDNLIVELSGEEVPCMDGSAAPFVSLINTVGIVEQDAPKVFMTLRREVRVEQGDAYASLKPFDGFKVNYTFVADHPVYNVHPKKLEIDFTKTSYIDEISRARTFGLIEDLEEAQAINRCLGSSLENAIGIDDHGVLNEGGLRYHDEFVKHKILDAIGDLYLLGRPLLAEFSGYKSGHSLNVKLAHALLRGEDAWELVDSRNGIGSSYQEIGIHFRSPDPI